ncbi:hypothetical protein Hokovirus_1_74 [Hokovirus HKV1]|uniref:PQ loop repeat protein n=1 Tax=Hokovirus HKV1 TaxID=1977638 RepID=A0A1V0SEQ0_9VIRU|nr:hypothetical protein Hokovirus_1_74 [Hokovirus HKV1]
MDINDIGIICGYVSGFITVVSLIPQIITLFRTKSCQGLSITMIIMLLIVSILNLLYGILAYLIPLILTNICTIILWSWILYLYCYYKYFYSSYENI